MRDISDNIVLEKNLLSTDSAWMYVLDADFNGTKIHYIKNKEDMVLVGDDYDSAGCAAHWKLDDDLATTVVLDASGNANHGTLEGGNNTEDVNAIGKVGDCFSLNSTSATDDYIDCSDPFELIFRDDFSISLLVKPDDGRPSVDQTLIGESNVASAGESSVLLTLLTSGKLKFQYSTDGNSGQDAVTNAAMFGDGAASVWTHIIIIADSDGKRIYVNGVEAALDAVNNGSVSGVTFADFTNNENNLFIGAENDDSSDISHYTGDIDNVSLFDCALTSYDIACLYNLGNNTAYVPLTYIAFSFILDMGGDEAKGELPKWTIQISNVSRVLEEPFESLDGMIGEEVTVRLINSEYPGEYIPGLARTFSIVTASSDLYWVTFTLAGTNLLRMRFPKRRYLANHCRWVFGSAECGYSGAHTECNRDPSDCVERNNYARYGGFRGLKPGAFKVV